MQTERILITVRTYPNISESHFETVCTGGINEQGEWRRLYPVPWRMLEENRKYRTWDEVEVQLEEISSDGRPESRRPDSNSFAFVRHVKDPLSRWLLVKPTVLDSMEELKNSQWTLRPVRVQQVLEFVANEVDPEWSDKQKDLLRQGMLFGGPDPLEKIPFDFRLRWTDGSGVEHDSKFLAWEVGQTWRKWRRKYPDPISRMREKWMAEVFGPDRELFFFMGNYAEHRQHYGICGWFNPRTTVTRDGTLL